MYFGPILYRIFIPFILLSVLMFVYGFKQLSKSKSGASSKKWKRMEKKEKNGSDSFIISLRSIFFLCGVLVF